MITQSGKKKQKKGLVGKERSGALTGSAARSASEAVTMAREASGAPQVSTTLAAPAGFARASTTAPKRKQASQREAARGGAAGEERSRSTVAVPLTRPRMSVVRARSGGQPGLSTAVVRGILRFGKGTGAGGKGGRRGGKAREREVREVGGRRLVFVRVLQRAPPPGAGVERGRGRGGSLKMGARVENGRICRRERGKRPHSFPPG
jgi:hypothetical protein